MYVYLILSDISVYLICTLARETFLVFPQQRLASYHLLNIRHFGTNCIPWLHLIPQQVYELFIINYHFTDEETDTGLGAELSQDLNPALLDAAPFDVNLYVLLTLPGKLPSLFADISLLSAFFYSILKCIHGAGIN